MENTANNKSQGYDRGKKEVDNSSSSSNNISNTKPNNSDIEDSVRTSGLKATSRPCIMLRKGVANHILIRIIALPEVELIKALKLFLSIFRIAYYRRFEKERDDPNKWWYWDLSKSESINTI